jgi:GrpB-like predicted nucleotidyltransferase (UPF0157 family)
MAVTLVESYNPEWTEWFREIKTFLGEKIADRCIRIEHVGSTSVPGMTAKPIIDLILVIEPQRFTEIKGLLAERGYYHNGDQGIKDREVFKLENEEVKNSLPLHHLYVCPGDSEELKRETAFREFLKRSPEYIKRLSRLKWSLAEEFDNDRDAYMAGKADLCREITDKALKYPEQEQI